jgi:hypothetical protein
MKTAVEQNTIMANTIKLYKEAFLTGCDAKTEWQLPWFIENYKKYNDTPLVFANFGVENLDFVREHFHAILDLTNLSEQGWFKKPKAMIHCPATKTVWLDTDIEVLADVSDIFDLLKPNKLNMVEDKPWTRRRREVWYNSGVVGFIGKPPILHQWARQVFNNPAVGDQEVLHSMLDPLNQLTYINSLPSEYNWLRLELNDGYDSNDKKMMHWTGPKGNEIIKEKMSA